MTKLILVRHGEAEGNINRRFHGHTDSKITENGFLQIEAVANRLKDEHIDAIYSSDLTRTYQTALGIAKGRGLEIIKTDKLREIYGGKWEDVLWEELPNIFPESYEFWLNDPLYLVMPGGESMVDFQNRVCNAVDEIVRENKGKTVCISTHGTVIKVLLCRYYGKSLSYFPEIIWCDNTSITVVEFDESFNPTVTVEGDNSHLMGISTLEKQSWWRKKLIEGEDRE
ncbi:MAG: Phosphoserine phosphatase 1 [Firmicutes bacterium ADurb.Bin193]|nr:MAG: Phosphoserine phosphatase 1 [Firmicutes bacterium ADurb.Bin193]